ncbi:MAG: UPF0158 family protein [Verrucomicrobia bacterium]|nr:UPF0158 family protein [Verrucomicrobiota bacterium]MBS0638081.1 UPF0158 family protein [Verrucomicrobiota bacterium]
MAVKNKLVAQNPLILRCHRLMEAFAKSDDERDFYLDRAEGFLVYIDLDKSQDELDELTKELVENQDRYCMIPKLTFYEVKKVMEGFVNEKVYDIDTKEKLLDIIGSKEARENFLEFIYDHHTELEKWQQYYQERFRVRIIEWLRHNQFDFVFEEDLEMTKSMCEKLKLNLFVPKVQKDLLAQRKNLMAKAKTYYSSEALNPRPKRGRPPKQVAKVETEPQFSQDIYTTIPKPIKPFLFAPEYQGSSAIFTFSGKFASEADLLAHRRQQLTGSVNLDMQNLNQKLAALRTLSTSWSIDKHESGQGELSAFEPSVDLSFEVPEILSKPLNGGKKEKAPKIEKPAPMPKKAVAVKEAPVKKAPIAKPAAKKPVAKVPAPKKAPPKARLRPLPKKAKPAAKPVKAAPVKTKATQFRKLRRAKKK